MLIFSLNFKLKIVVKTTLNVYEYALHCFLWDNEKKALVIFFL